MGLRRNVLAGVVGGWSIAILCSCAANGSPTTAPATATSPSATETASAIPAPVAATQADLEAVYAKLYPTIASGGNCFQAGGSATPSFATCPVTPRLDAALVAAVATQGSGAGADPVCGCQNIDPNQSTSYTVGTPPGGGTIHVTAFGTPHIAYVVIASGGSFLVDDIIYCGSSVTSIYAAETPASC